MNQIIVQGIGFAALLFVIFSFQKNKRSALLSIMLAGLVLFAVHYSLLHAWTGMTLNLIEALMVYVSYQGETKPWAKQKFWPYVFILLFIIAGLAISRTLIGILPIIAQSFGTIAAYQKNPRAIRFIMLVPRPLWFLYNLSVGSYAGMVTEIFILLSVVIGIIRFDILGKDTQPKE